jgi:hypothetical protein
VHREFGFGRLNYSSARRLGLEMMFELRMRCYIVLCMVLWSTQLCTTARAQALRLALFKTSVSSSELTPLAAALDPVLQAEVGRLPNVSIAAVPPLDLPSLQLALDCVGETPECLSLAADRSKADGLLAASLTRSGAARVLSLMVYDPRESSALHVVTRSFATDASDGVVIDGAKSLVHELFGDAAPPPAAAPTPTPPPSALAVVEEPPAAPTTLAPAPEPAPAPAAPLTAASPAPAQAGPSLVVPIVLSAVGLAAVGVGVGFGIASNNSESRYADMRINDANDAKDANDVLSRARSQATVANIAVGVGAASCVAGAVVYLLQRKRAPERAPHARVSWGPTYLGVTGDF